MNTTHPSVLPTISWNFIFYCEDNNILLTEDNVDRYIAQYLNHKTISDESYQTIKMEALSYKGWRRNHPAAIRMQ